MSEYPSGHGPAGDGPVPPTAQFPVQPYQPQPYQPTTVQPPQQQYPVQHHAAQQQYGYGPGAQSSQVVHHVHHGPPIGYKDTTVAFLLWFFLGHLGADRFYLNQVGAGVGILLLWMVGWLTAIFVIGFFMLFGVLVWWIVNACMIQGQVRAINARLTQGF